MKMFKISPLSFHTCHEHWDGVATPTVGEFEAISKVVWNLVSVRTTRNSLSDVNLGSMCYLTSAKTVKASNRRWLCNKVYRAEIIPEKVLQKL